MKHVKARFKVVTPCFIGSGRCSETLRPLPSIKGVLRFWWRALNYATCADITELRKQENELFGSSNTGQSRIVMRLDMDSPTKFLKRGECLRDGGKQLGPGARYLGYGVIKAGQKAGELIHLCFEAPFEFVLRIGAKDKGALRQVEPALRLLGLVGGLGARSRKGYGSLNLTALEGDGIDPWQPPQTVDDYRACLCSLLETAVAYDREPEISAFSSCASIYMMFKNTQSPVEVLDKYGEEMVRYRSWGRDGKILDGETSNKLFSEDHDWMKRKMSHEKARDFHPRRAVFGLPHNYGKNSEVRAQHYSRRASPLLFHIHQIGKRYAGIALLLRSRFLPEDEKIMARGRPVPASPDWQVLKDFLDDKWKNAESRGNVDANRKERIWPDG